MLFPKSLGWMSGLAWWWMALFVLGCLSCTTCCNAQSDYINPDAPLTTIYEIEEQSPQNMDFDLENNMFVAHSGWYQDQLLHYYKFRMYTPDTYPQVITAAASAGDVPLQNVFFVTTSGDFTGVVGLPVIPFHTSDGLSYSDFMVVNFVTAPSGYVENTYKSVGDIQASGSTTIPTDIVLNMPIVPFDSILQHPITKGTNPAPIDPTMVWFKGVQVQTFVFEVTDPGAAEFFASTRTNSNEQGFEIPVVPFGASAIRGGISAIPIWHLNQYTRGVTEGTNGGGPNPAGMRNIIDMDRPDSGYSPLWQIFWGTKLPINYNADELSNAAYAVESLGFEFVPTTMFVNCPNIGPVDTTINPNKADFFHPTIDPQELGTDPFWILGAPELYIMSEGDSIDFETDTGIKWGETETNAMGAFEYEHNSGEEIRGSTSAIRVLNSDSIELYRIQVGPHSHELPDPNTPPNGGDDGSSSAATLLFFGRCGMAVAALQALML